MLQSLGVERPEDAVSEVDVNGEKAYLIHGQFSQDLTEWDYDVYLSLYFEFNVSHDEKVGVMLRALLPSEWITAGEMIKIAESIRLD